MKRMLTAKGEATRERIVRGAAAEMRQRGVANTSLDDIRAVTATSKSQIFHYFPEGRTDLLLAVARHEADRVLADQLPYLYQLDSWPVWQAWRDLIVRRYRDQGSTCPLSVLIAQIGPGFPESQAIVADLLQRWQRSIEAGILTMQQQGEISPEVAADRAAAALLAGIQGGVVFLLATGSSAHLEAALDQGIASLRRDDRPMGS